MNHLENETSPYLLQHARNPVEWYPWSDEAFGRALKEDKPIFLSIGYSTCHWCHVMEKESFCDNGVAALMNDAFINIKVDREERPDIDNVYMNICQIMTGHGGWPLTIIMSSDKRPFFAGTYIPKESRIGMMGMSELITHVKKLWTNQRSELLSISHKITAIVTETVNSHRSNSVIDEKTIEKAYNGFLNTYDRENGGFGQHPKFPASHNLLFLIRYYHSTKDKMALEMVEHTLKNMRMGGIFDHLGFGFHRYSTDTMWRVPHFEKMLYDQAMLIMAYTDGFQVTGNPLFKNTVAEIIEYVFRELATDSGPFSAAQDADSEGEEGKFYLWSFDELQNVLREKDFDLALKTFNIKKEGNYKHELTGGFCGQNILYLTNPEDATVNNEEIEKLRKNLLTTRDKRTRLHIDSKILTDWNSLMVVALAKAGNVFENPQYIEHAKTVTDFILSNMIDKDGHLFHRYTNGSAGLNGNLDDYSFFIWALIELYEATFDLYYLETAVKYTKILIGSFWDDRQGGFFFTPEHGEWLLIRPKEVYDGAIPSGNSVTLFNLHRLFNMTGHVEFFQKAKEMLVTFADKINQHPHGYAFFLKALFFSLGQTKKVVICAPSRDDNSFKEVSKVLQSGNLVDTVFIAHFMDEESGRTPDFLKGYTLTNNQTTYYLCENNTCKEPTTDTKKFLQLLFSKNI